ncbi:MAG: hypothetical protein LBQ42_08875 [Synergistaceae bacterium]|jgi:hypothetical protein|nr:hypothetical protein [Synergistaceae bacterium]
MRKKIFVVALLLAIIFAQIAEATPTRGYLNAREIKNLLDQFSGIQKRSEVETRLGRPLKEFEDPYACIYASTQGFLLTSTLTKLNVRIKSLYPT